MKRLFLLILCGAMIFPLRAQISFAPATNYPVAGGPTWVTAADVNNDGSTDLITANVFAGTVSVLTNDGHGGFGFSSTISVGAGPGFVAAADVNGDGWLDLVCANGGGSTLSVLTNDCHGGFAVSSTLNVGNNPYSLVVVDINGDGKPDVVSANDSDNTLSVLTNNGTGNFALAATLDVGGSPNTVVTADVNRDGKPDLICANYGPSTLSILTNNGAGGFALASSPYVGASPYGCVAADVNGDGNIDLVSASYAGGGGNTLSVLINDGAGGFALASSPGVSPAALGVIAADMNLDGKIDLICPNYGPQSGHTLTVLTNNGYGGFAIAAVPNADTGPDSVTAADVNGDGKPDLISANLFGGTISVILNTSTIPIHGATAAAVLTNGVILRVDILDGGFGYTNTPLVRFIGGGGSGGQATAILSNGVVTAIEITSPGGGYTNAPVVVIDPPFVPVPILGIAPMTFLSFSNLAVGGGYQLQRLANWYWENQPVSFTAAGSQYTQFVGGVVSTNNYRLALTPVPAQAFATPQVVNGFIVGANVTSGGSGYVTNPAVTVIGGGGSNCVVASQISGGVVTGINILDAGRGYTGTPTLQITPPPAAAVFPATVQPVMRVDAANLVPYDNYQIQFKGDLNAPWSNWNGGLFMPVNAASSQYLFISNSVGYFRVQLGP